MQTKIVNMDKTKSVKTRPAKNKNINKKQAETVEWVEETKEDKKKTPDEILVDNIFSNQTPDIQRISYLKKLDGILFLDQNPKVFSQNLTLIKKLKVLYEETKEIKLKNQIIITISHFDHKDSTLFIMENYENYKKLEQTCAEALFIHLEMINDKIGTEEDPKALNKYKKAKEKIEKFLKANNISLD